MLPEKTIKKDRVYFTTPVPDTSDMSATRTTRVEHECNTSATRTTRVQHKWDTSDTNATQVLNEQHDCVWVLNERHECYKGEKFWFW